MVSGDEDGSEARPPEGIMRIDCNECVMQDTAACHDCVVTHLLGVSGTPIDIDDEHEVVLESLAAEGMVPRLRLIPRASNE
jgi:hypothetical protein